MKKITCIFVLILSSFVKADITPISEMQESALNEKFKRILTAHKVNTIGVALIKSSNMQWSGYYGEQSPGVAANNESLFNVGSITKTVVTQTVLQLVKEQLISLDEPMSNYWVDPDVVRDARHKELTPRMVLSHTTGFPNWRFFSADRKLKLLNAPGTNYGYSGEGFEYLAKFVEKKLGTPFEALAQEYVFSQLGLDNISLSVNEAYFPRITQALDENGKFYGHYCSPQGWCSKPGDVSVAGNMVASVEDYSKFLIWSMQGAGLPTELVQQIESVSVEQEIIKGFDCSKLPHAICPTRQGYGLGWNVTEFKNGSVVGHGGSDWSLITLAYYYPDSRDGVVIFINGPNTQSKKAMIDAITLLDPQSPKLHEYRYRLDRDATKDK